jgi:3-oxoacyl-[acyl-carrier-protein] synthase II
MRLAREVVITGVGIVSPIGIGTEPFWRSLTTGYSGVRRLAAENGCLPPVGIGAEVVGFSPLRYVRPRKSLKVMSRDIQFAFAAAELACQAGAIDERPIPPDRLGIVFGADLIPTELTDLLDVYRACIVDGRFDFTRWGGQARAEIYPLWLLKYLPNMPASHIGIARDARGPSNTLTLGEVSGLAAVCEAVRVIQRGQADAMIAGGASARLNPVVWTRREACQLSRRLDDPAAACRPFDADRDGIVYGEGAGAFLLEERGHAQSRGATAFARVLGHASRFEPRRRGEPLRGDAIREAIRAAIRAAGLAPGDIGHVNAHGASTTEDDRIEALAIRNTLGDVPVMAPKSFFGSLGAGAGVVEMAASVLAFHHGLIPPTLNYERPDPACPIQVIHGQPQPLGRPTALVHNQSPVGQSIAVVISGEL